VKKEIKPPYWGGKTFLKKSSNLVALFPPVNWRNQVSLADGAADHC
jgi:hypothetical protein